MAALVALFILLLLAAGFIVTFARFTGADGRDEAILMDGTRARLARRRATQGGFIGGGDGGGGCDGGGGGGGCDGGGGGDG